MLQFRSCCLGGSRFSGRSTRPGSRPLLLVRWTSNPSNPQKPLLPPEHESWVDRLPQRAQPYIRLVRLEKPIGTALLYLPCAWAINMASFSQQVPISENLWYLGLFGAGAIVMRGAGCTINDMWDRNLDKSVARTKDRPLARGDIPIVPHAWLFLATQLSVGLGVLVQLNFYSIMLGAASLSVVSIYPFMKRVTHWPQAVLGLAFNWGAMLGWSAVLGAVNWTVCLPLYAGGICWTLVYDSIYAHQDKRDDIKVGIHSTALLFGDYTRPILTGLSTASLSFITYAGWMNGHGTLFYGGIALAAAELARVVYRTNFDDRASCWRGFVGCGWSGFMIGVGSFLDFVSPSVASLPWSGIV